MEAFLYTGIAYYESKNQKKALEDFDKVIQYHKQSADAKYYKAHILTEFGETGQALEMVNQAFEDFNNGYFNNRPYVETLLQIYLEDLEELKTKIIASN